MIPDTTPSLETVITDVVSSFISRIEFNPTDSEMTVHFISGSEYTYPNMTRLAYDNICSADSVGKALNAFKGSL